MEVHPSGSCPTPRQARHPALIPKEYVSELLKWRTKSLKGITAKRANEMLRLTGKPFWQEESYDRVVRNGQELERIQHYIEWNPVRAGLVHEARDYPWSSAEAAG